MNYYLDVLKNKYALFNGRARRAEYWQFFLFNILVSFVLGFIGSLIHFPYIGIIYSFGVIVPGIALAVRRMHDVNKDWWYALIPIYNLILACTEGTAGPNDYGPDPKGTSTDSLTSPTNFINR